MKVRSLKAGHAERGVGSLDVVGTVDRDGSVENAVSTLLDSGVAVASLLDSAGEDSG